MHIAYLHHNPTQWVEPEDYIPERFDHKDDKYYLTPSGKRRHPMSFTPFLGGKRICLGKTLAESIGKCVLTVILGQVDFEFEDPKVKVDKPPSTIFHEQPKYRMTVKAL